MPHYSFLITHPNIILPDFANQCRGIRAIIPRMNTPLTPLPQRLAVGRTAELFAWEDGRVLKLFNAGISAATADHEARLGMLVQAAGLPAPAVYGRLDLNGRAGILYERIEGSTLLSRITARPLMMPGWGRSIAHLQHQIHQTAISDLDTIHERLERSIARAPGLPESLQRDALDRLKHLPERNALLHGDFHPDNILIAPRGPVVIDWLDASRGHPLADVARTHLLMTGPLPPTLTAGQRLLIRLGRDALVRAYLGSYFRLSGFKRADLRAWMLPVAAARLAEEVPGDRERLVPLMQRMI